jgi:membrane associated rhomboid family serine protease
METNLNGSATPASATVTATNPGFSGLALGLASAGAALVGGIGGLLLGRYVFPKKEEEEKEEKPGKAETPHKK